MKRLLPFVFVVSLMSVSPAVADDGQVGEPAIKAMRLPITKYDASGGDAANLVCPKGSEKLFMLKVFIRTKSAGTFYQAQKGKIRLKLTSGEVVKDPGYPVPPSYRENDYFAYPESPSRFAMVDMAAKNVVTIVVTADAAVRVGRLKSVCQEQF